jgi:hypothetical protein
VFVVGQIKKADEAFKDLNALAPDKVAVWTNEHDPSCKEREQVLEPAALFTKEELRHYQIIVVTHAFYNGKNGYQAHVALRQNKHIHNGRALTIVDERPEEVAHYEITLKEAQDIREKLEAKRHDLTDTLDKLMSFILPESIGAVGNVIMRASDRFDKDLIADHLSWFTSDEAEGVVAHHSKAIAGLDQLFGFARALAAGCAFAVGEVVHSCSRKWPLWPNWKRD